MPAASGRRQRTFSLVSGSHLSMSPVSRAIRFCSGPRQLGQSIESAAKDCRTRVAEIKRKRQLTANGPKNERNRMLGSRRDPVIRFEQGGIGLGYVVAFDGVKRGSPTIN